MDIIGQIKAAFEAGAKFLWGIFLAAIVVTYVNHLRPEWFFGLPQWIIPTVRLVMITFGVLALVSAVESVFSSLKRFWRFLLTPCRNRRIRRKLLDISISEIFFICIALTSQSRSLSANPDSEHILSLKRKGLIKSMVWAHYSAPQNDSFVVPMEVWEQLLTMKEFQGADTSGIKSLARDFYSDRTIKIELGVLPPHHPSVLAKSKRVQ